VRVPALRVFQYLAVAVSLGACADLDVLNYNEPDAYWALSDPEGVAALISGSFHTWFNGSYDYCGPGLFLSSQTFQHNAPWANCGMEHYGRIPRVALVNNASHENYRQLSRMWDESYRANAAVANGLRALESPGIASRLGPQAVTRLRAFGKFMQGLCLATVAVFYDRGFIVDESTDVTLPQELVGYQELMEAALAKFDDAIAVAGSASFELPFDWMQADLTSGELALLAHSYRARFRAQVARTPEERAAVDWGSVIADVDLGLPSTFTIDMDWNRGWQNTFLQYATWPGWNQLAYFMYGMADQSGAVSEWLSLPLGEKGPLFTDGRPVLIVTPDLRFPQGSTVEEQRSNEGLYFRIASSREVGDTWQQPARGSWRWSWYKAGYNRGLGYAMLGFWEQPEITLAEVRLLKAEGLYRNGDRAGAAEIINETRVPSGLNATDATGTNTSCVPRLPDGSCGDLWEMLKWEKRMETVWTGVAGATWFFDGRGWGDLWKETPLQLPVPCRELQVLQMLPCTTFGGPGGNSGSPGSTYAFPFEG
jgi:hypothetical protein